MKLERDVKILIIGSILVSLSLGYLLYPTINQMLLPTSITIIISPLYQMSNINLRHSTITLHKNYYYNITLTFSQDILSKMNCTKGYTNPIKPYTELNISSNSFSQNIILLKCDILTISFSKTSSGSDITILPVVVTITEKVVNQ